jgi:hypothetical protein
MSILAIWIIIWVVIILLIIILLLSLQLANRNYIPDKYINFDPCLFETGDIIYNSYGNFLTTMITCLIGSPWTHSGVIWCDSKTNEKYVLEMCSYKPPYYRGVYKVPLSTWININKKSNMIGYMKLHRSDNKKPHFHNLEDIYNTYKNIKLEAFCWRYYRFFQQKPYEKINSKGANACHEITIAVLQDLGVYKKECSVDSYTPSDLIYQEIPMNYPYYYSDIVGLNIDFYKQIYKL